MLILGLNAYHGDVAAALLRDGELICAIEEERLRRVKHCAGFPHLAIQRCLEMAGVEAHDVDIFAVARDAQAHRLRKIWFGLTHRPGLGLLQQHGRSRGRQRAIAGVIADALKLAESHVAPRVRHIEHHPAHLASAFYASGFATAVCCAVDGFGDFVSVSIGRGDQGSIDVRRRVFFPHSLGLFYLAITQWLGFKEYGDEFKVMGLAPYGEPRHADQLSRLVQLHDDGGFHLDLQYFRHWTGEVSMEWSDGRPVVPDVFTPRLEALIGPSRAADAAIDQHHQDIAASVQQVFEQSLFHLLRHAHRQIPLPHLCLAGGCAMNSVANGKIRRETPFEHLYVQPAAGDNGTALGAALQVWHQELNRPRQHRMEHGYWGTSYDNGAIESALAGAGASAKYDIWRERNSDALCGWTADRLAEGNIVGWFQGRMEWGARALGNRSILADPRRSDMRDVLNAKIKMREKFRPFAPAILEDALDEYFVDAAPDPFMAQVYPIQPAQRSAIPAVTHVDGSGRLQTVSDRTNPLFAKLLRAFRSRTGVPVLLNTSFNENEPIVESPAQALDCFLRTDMDVLVMGDYVLQKARAAS
jgi:carbamoyltransferase